MKENRILVIDADHILYLLATTPGKAWDTTLKGKVINERDYKAEYKQMKKSFKAIIKTYVDYADIEGVAQGFAINKVMPVISYETNFRYEIFPDYKKNRKETEHTKGFIELREWARKKYSYKNVEADDVVAYYVRKGAIGVSTDKDLLKGVPGIWYDAHHMRQTWQYTSKESAKRFNLMQYVAGDTADSIPGIPRVGLTTAEKLLNEYGWSWEAVVRIYLSRGLTEHDAITTRRLISMEQWSPKKGVKLFGKVYDFDHIKY